ncbi:DUF4914 family protein [Mucisphaera calidilacus]|nr:DUF4914 family protein [Mucisphaera calidilacus]
MSQSAEDVLKGAKSATFVGSVEDLIRLAVPEDGVDARGIFTVGYEVEGRGYVPELEVCRVRNGISANYVEPYMRRRDPDCMVIADKRPTGKRTWDERFPDKDWEDVRQATFDWMKTQDLAYFVFNAGLAGKGTEAVAIAPANAAFFALGLAMLQGILPKEEIREEFFHEAIIYVAPPFRHTHFEGRQVVVHNRREQVHELFSYNLYPGPSAKKGIYGVLLNRGEYEGWVTAHCSTVQVVTPYDNTCTIMHEGASGGGKSEMLEQMHREQDGQIRLGTNTVTGESKYLTLPRGCRLHPVTDDMALCHPDYQKPEVKKLTLYDAEDAWFLRVNHITKYGTDPHLEAMTINPPSPLLFLNIDAKPGSTALIWDAIEDEPGVPCPNPRVIMPRKDYPNIVTEPVTVDVRSFGVRTPPCTAEQPTYGVLGMINILPPALAWLWRLVAPRGHANPSIVDTQGMTSEGVGSYWPFATGRAVDQANLLLSQFMNTDETLFVLIPNQHVGCWETSFTPQWIVREYLARRGSSVFPKDRLLAARCPLLGYSLKSMQVEGTEIPEGFLRVETQPEVGESGYDAGAEVLKAFFHDQISAFSVADLDPHGQKIIEACLSDASVTEYEALGPGA